MNGPHRAAESRMNTKLNFGQPQNRFFVLQHQPVITGHREFEAATQGKSVDGGNGWTAQRLQAIEHLLPQPDQFIGLLGRFNLRELVDVGAHNESIALAGMNDESAGRIVFVRRDNVRELPQD